MHILAGEFTIAKWEEKSFLEVVAPTKAHEAEIAYTVKGDLIGQLTGKYIMIYQNDNEAQYCGALQFIGSIGEKNGSFFMQETGVFGDGIAQTKWTIMGGSGQDDLCNIAGSGHYAAQGETVKFELQLETL